MKHLIITTLALAMLLTVAALAADQQSPAEQAPAITDSTTASESPAADRIVVTYFHGDRRCATCMKLEAYSQEAIVGEFADDLRAGKIEWRTINFDEDANKHFAKDYGLYSQSLVLSHVVDGEEVAWKNLDQIWKLVGDKDKFLPYVRTATHEFMAPPSKE